MKRIALVVTAALVAATPALASAAPGKGAGRTLTHDYQGFVGVAVNSGLATALTGCPANDACWDFPTVKGEKTVTLSAKDATGRKVPFQVYLDDDYEGTLQVFCGAGSLKLSPKRAAAVSIRMTASAECDGLPSEGTLTAVVAKS